GVPIFAADALGGKLDRRQRILDLVSDPAGDIGPSGGSLGNRKLRHIVEGDDHTAIGHILLLARDLHRKVALAAFADDRYLTLHRLCTALPAGFLDDLREFGDGRLQGLADEFCLPQLEELTRGAVYERYATRRVEPDHSGGNPG